MTGSNPQLPVFKDRSLGLVVFGSVAVLIGVFCALLVPLTLVGLVVGGAGGVAPRSALSAIAMYTVGAVAFVVLGIGSIRARRWARALLLSLSWIWLLTGLCSLAVGLLVLPPLMRQLAAESGLPPSWVVAVNLVIIAVGGVAYGLLPGAFVLFYRSPHVEATCRSRDPGSEWIERCPRRLLTLTVVWVLLAVSVLLMPGYNFVFPLFGLVATGGVGAGFWLIVLVVCAALAIGTCRRAPWAWWGGVALTVVVVLSSSVTLLRYDLLDLVALLELPDDEVARMALLAVPEGWPLVMINLVVWGTFVAYLWSLRGLFTRSSADDEA